MKSSFLKTLYLQVTMIIKEVLRLYPPAPFIIRARTRPVKLGNTALPVGVELTLLIGLLHYDPKIWGKDVKEFKPQRFSEGIFNATKTQLSRKSGLKKSNLTSEMEFSKLISRMRNPII